MEKAYQFRLYPNDAQEALLAQSFGCCRFVFNHFLEERIRAWQSEKKTLGFYECCKRLTELKLNLPWLKEADSTALQSSLRSLDNAFQNFFRGLKTGQQVGYPKFKSKREHRDSYTSKAVGKNIELGNKAIKLPKLGWVKCRVSKQVDGRILSATVSKTPSGKYFVSVLCTDVVPQQKPHTGAVVGLDLGIKDLITTSDGAKFDNTKALRSLEKKLAREQRRLSRKSKGSKRYERQRIKVAKIHERITDTRKDALHKASTTLVENYDIICVENLNVKGMVRNHHLAKAISDASFGELLRQLKYKAAWHDKELIEVGMFYPSSQLCSCCGHQNPALKDLKIRSWICPQCGAAHDRDINAATNILNQGLKLRTVA